LRLLRARDDADAQHVLEVKPDLRREVVVEQEERPGGLRAFSEWGVAVRRKPERDIGRRVEIAVQLLWAVDRMDTSVEKRAIEFAVEDVLDDTADVLELGAISHALGLSRVGQEGLKAGDQRNVGEFPPSPARSLEAILLAKRAGSEIRVLRADVTNAGIDAAVIDFGPEFRHASDMLLSRFPRAHVARFRARIPEIMVGVVGDVMLHLP
jgi:hypothetical protein